MPHLSALSLALNRPGAVSLEQVVASLFAAGEQGAWYDPSDYSTMFQVSTGATPVTAVEQPVGLILDKRKGLVLGSELVTNGTFDTTTTGWTASAVTPSVSGGVLTLSGGTGYFYQTFTTVVGRHYKVTGDIIQVGTSFSAIRKADDASASVNVVTIASAVGSASAYFIATATTTYIVLQHNSSVTDAKFDNISVRLIDGNHAYQTGSTARPVLRARYNLLTYSEQFNNAAWFTNTSSVTIGTNASGSVAPDGTQTAETMTETAGARNRFGVFYALGSPLTSAAYTYSVYIKQNTGSRFVRVVLNTTTSTDFACVDVNPSNGNITQTLTSGSVTNVASSTTSVGNGWHRVTITGRAAFQYMTVAFVTTSTTPAGTDFGYEAYTGTTDHSIYIWGADLRVGTSAGDYQRIEAAPTAGGGAVTYATTSTITGQPFRPYLLFDGGDDALVTSSIDLSAGSKATIWAGVTKSSDAATASIFVYGANHTDGPGMELYAPPSNGSASYAIGASSSVAGPLVGTTPTNYAAPTNNVLAASVDVSIAGSGGQGQLALRVNGASQSLSWGGAGTNSGNLGTKATSIGSRVGAVRFNGRIYSLFWLARAATASELSAGESYAASKMGITL